MMLKLAACFCLVVTAAFAQASVSDAELATAYTECAAHRSPDATLPGWDPGWEHCHAVWQEHGVRAKAAFDALKKKDPATSKAVADKLIKK